jgi:hypothetical protein
MKKNEIKFVDNQMRDAFYAFIEERQQSFNLSISQLQEKAKGFRLEREQFTRICVKNENKQAIREATWKKLKDYLSVTDADWEDYYKKSKLENTCTPESPATSRDSSKNKSLTDEIEVEPQKFIQEIKSKLAEELDQQEFGHLREALITEINKLDILDKGEDVRITSGSKSVEILDKLATILQIGGTPPPVINKVLTNAVINEFERTAKNNETISKDGKLVALIKQILGLLVLAALDAKELSSYLQDRELKFIEIPVHTYAGVEAVISYQTSLRPGIDIKQKHVLPVDELRHIVQHNWSADEIVNKIKLVIWHELFGEQKQMNLTKDDCERLRIKITNLYQVDSKHEHHRHFVAAFKFDRDLSDQINEDTQKLLQRVKQLLDEKLPSLRLVRFGFQGERDVFVVAEDYLIDAVETLLNEIYKRTSA